MPEIQTFMVGFEKIQDSRYTIEYSENKIITYLESETRPGVLQSSIKQTYALREISDSKGRIERQSRFVGR